MKSKSESVIRDGIYKFFAILIFITRRHEEILSASFN